MKKRFPIILIAILLIAMSFGLSACGISYGDAYPDINQLQQHLEAEGLDLLYPAYRGEGVYETSYVATYDKDVERYVGYKIYHMCSPFFVSIYSYTTPSDKVLSDDPDALTLEEEALLTDKGTARLYSGKTKEDNLYLIAAIVIDGVQYEVRIVNDKTLADNSFVNAITKENGNYPKAVQQIKEVLATLG